MNLLQSYATDGRLEMSGYSEFWKPLYNGQNLIMMMDKCCKSYHQMLQELYGLTGLNCVISRAATCTRFRINFQHIHGDNKIKKEYYDQCISSHKLKDHGHCRAPRELRDPPMIVTRKLSNGDHKGDCLPIYIADVKRMLSIN
ncbi:hypothetical protein OPV22_032972 [Ensete ventricosum]|uniref:Uncharacterized protein n=1 Tax=Ensete ventricosum TaxID=4639 RepID=A0AAV8P0I9_ENSVE|nr:hypothetical protein OPV22_032972 [Ensete ventricosum]